MTESIEFSEDEQRFIAGYLQRRNRNLDLLLHYGAYILPSAIFAVYAIAKREFLAAIVAYAALLVVALIYLSYSRQSTETFESVLRKCDALAKAQKVSRVP